MIRASYFSMESVKQIMDKYIEEIE